MGEDNRAGEKKNTREKREKEHKKHMGEKRNEKEEGHTQNEDHWRISVRQRQYTTHCSVRVDQHKEEHKEEL